MKIINDHLSSAFLSFFPAGNTEDRRTGEEEEKTEKERSALEVGEKRSAINSAAVWEQ